MKILISPVSLVARLGSIICWAILQQADLFIILFDLWIGIVHDCMCACECVRVRVRVRVRVNVCVNVRVRSWMGVCWG